MVLVLGIVKASLEILGIGIGVKKVVLLMSGGIPSASTTRVLVVADEHLIEITTEIYAGLDPESEPVLDFFCFTPPPSLNSFRDPAVGAPGSLGSL